MTDAPQIAFVRSKLSLLPMFEQHDPWSDTIVGSNTIVAPYPLEALPQALAAVEGPQGRADWVDYFEVIEIAPDMTAATDLEIQYDDELEDAALSEDADWLQRYGTETEPRPSERLRSRFEYVGLVEKPNFGRRMLMVRFEHTADDRQINRASTIIRRRLGHCVSVWQGQTFAAFGFIDNRPPDRIMEPLYYTLDGDEIADYLMVQPVQMIVPDVSGLSPLGDWMLTATSVATRAASG